ncbi:MAG: hypothetical protein AB8I08_18855 [Sandaracinaceae bacterium]
MGPIPSSLVAAVACSAAAGKNPWLPLAMIFLLAAPESVPDFVMASELHGPLHGLMPVEALWSFGAVFGVLAVADSLADKIGFIEKWLVPVSTAWRPFAGIACSTLLGVAAAQGTDVEVAGEVASQLRMAVSQPAEASVLVGSAVVVLTVAVSAVYTWIATVSKTGIRLALSFVPVPGLKFAHSLLDDFFAVGATIAGLAFGDTVFVTVLVVLYLVVGLMTAPVLTRLAIIHLRIGLGLLRKARNKVAEAGTGVPAPPAWVQAWLGAQGIEGATVLPGYVYRAPELGWCRGGHLVLADGKTAFLTRIWWRPRAWVVDEAALARIGLAETPTARVVSPVERIASGALRSVAVYLYPAVEDEVLPAIEGGAREAGLLRVSRDSESARNGLPGYADRAQSVRFAPASDAGSLRLQGLLTIAGAIGVGVLTGGVFVPIGLGYLVSPFKRRAVLGLLVSGYFALCVLGSMGLGWPLAVLYASILNAVALRDLTRNALKARVEGYVDRRAWLPLTATRVWVPRDGMVSSADRHVESTPDPTADGGWRAVMDLLATAPAS